MNSQQFDNNSEQYNVVIAGHGNDDGHGNDFVTIFYNDHPFRIHRGRQSVPAIKSACQIPSADILVLLPELKDLADSESLVIHGNEHFTSVPPGGASS